MAQTSFDLECDRLSGLVDSDQFLRLHWERNEGPMLAKLVAFAHNSFENHGEFELTEEGSTSACKRFVVKVHSKRVFALSFAIDEGHAVVTAEPADRSAYRLVPGEPLSAPMEDFDEEWVANALQQMFSRVQTAQ